jgi:small subunit ribosomal protein S29e
MKTNQRQEARKKQAMKRCRVCKGTAGIIKKYGMNICRRCFKDQALQMGFRKF